MRAAVKAAVSEGQPMSQRALTLAMKMKAALEVKRAGIDLAVGRGLLLETSGPRRSRLFQVAPTTTASDCVPSASDALTEATDMSASVRLGLSLDPPIGWAWGGSRVH